MINFRKGSKDEFAKLPPEAEFGDRADIIRRHLAEVFGSKNLSFLIGSGCSSYMHEGNELGIPTMGPLAAEFQATLLRRLPSLPKQHALIFGSAVKIPTTFRVRDADPTPNSDDTQVRDLWYVPEDPRLGWNS